MELKFTDEKKWGKKAYGGFATAIIGVFLIVFQLYLGGSMDSLLVFMAFIPVIIGLAQGLYYISRHEKDYIYLAEDFLTIYHGPLLPRTEIAYSNIDHCSVVRDLLIITLKNDKEKQINTDLLSDEDVALLREELKKSVRANLFRIHQHLQKQVPREMNERTVFRSFYM